MHGAGIIENASLPSLSAAEFDRVRRMAHRHFGLDLKEGKQALVEARLAKPLRRRGFRSFRQYCDFVESDASGEGLAELANVLTTNYTSFLREPAHFEYLRRVIAPALASQPAPEIWSAACSTGEEPYSILFTLLDALPSAAVRVLATDISTRALAAAAEGIFRADALSALPEGWQRRYFLRGNGRCKDLRRVKEECRARVDFQRLNLIEGELPARRFPLIFCRNVMIYFDKPTQETVVRRLASRLAPGGILFIGHSESLAGVRHDLQYVQPAIYRLSGGSS